MKQQILVIHGGDSFNSQKEYLDYLKSKPIDLDRLRFSLNWKDSLQDDLGDKFDVLNPRMPNGTNAQYDEWKLWFERILPALDRKLILIGHSLGGVFLAKYLAENNINKTLKAVVLVAAPYKASDGLGQFALTTNLINFGRQAPKILLIQSEDDPVVPKQEVDLYKKELPSAESMIFKDSGHFQIEHFPELVNWVKSLKL